MGICGIPALTNEGGFAVVLKNNTGGVAKKGMIVAVDTSEDNAVVLCPAAGLIAMGVVYDDNIADGNNMRVVLSGRADILLEDGTGSTAGNWVIPSLTVAGRADADQPAPPNGSTLAEHQQHFAEIGHCLETKSSGTDVLVKCIIHFN